MSGLAGISLGARLLGIRKALARVPWWAWVALAAVALLGWRELIYWPGKVRSAYADGAKAGAERAYARVEEKARNLERQASEAAIKIRSKFNEASRRVDADSRALLVRGPGRATCLNPATPAAGRSVPPSGAGGDTLRPVPGGEGQQLAGVPFTDLVEVARQCDLNRLEVLAWRAQRAEQVRAWEKAGGNVTAASPSGSPDSAGSPQD